MDSWDKPRIREMVRERPEYKDGRLTEEQVETIVDEMSANKDQLIEEYVRAEIRRELIRMVGRGEAEYDAETDSYRRIDE
jgi:hypothetical protein